MTEVIVVTVLIVGLAILSVVCISIAVKKVISPRTPEVPDDSADAWGVEAGPPSLLRRAHESSGLPIIDVDGDTFPDSQEKPKKIDVWKAEEERTRRLWRIS